jgi:AraC family transcriptional regulator of adaptative response / DNA-3-methyladenine glycosylase II
MPQQVSLNLEPTAPYDWSSLVRFISARIIPGVDHVEGQGYSRTISLGRGTGSLAITPAAKALSARVHFTGSIDDELVSKRLRRLANTDAPIGKISKHLARDKRLAPLMRKRPGLRVPGVWDPFELGVRAILGQQVSVAGATTLAGRIALKFGRKIKTSSPKLTHLFPTAATMADANLSGMGLTTRRAATITGFAKALCATPSLLDSSKPLDDFVAGLVSLNGFGPWTAHYMAMRLGYTDAFPASDLGVRKALAMAPEKEVIRIAEPWRPYRASAAMHLWMSLGD